MSADFKGEGIRKGSLIEEFARAFSAALKNLRIFLLGHPMVGIFLDKLWEVVEELFKDRTEIALGLIGEILVIENLQFYQFSPTASFIVERLQQHEIERMVFYRGMEKGELMSVLDVLVGKPPKEGLEALLLSKGISHLKIGKLHLDYITKKEKEEEEEGIAQAKKLYLKGVDALQGVFPRIREGKGMEVEEIRTVVEGLVSNALLDSSFLLSLVNLKIHDDYTFTHAMNNSILTVSLAQSLGIEKERLRDFGLAAMMHDVGKELIPKEILQKSGKLSEEEFRIIQRHCQDGAKILLDFGIKGDLAVITAFEHHLKYDLSGYPSIRQPRKPNLCSILVAIADIYDALRSERSYRESLPPEKAAAIMMDLRGRDFHPYFLDRFFQIVGIYPHGTLVRLDTGEVGVVYRINPQASGRPLVKLLYAQDGTQLDPIKLIDLREREGSAGYLRTIIESMDPSRIKVDLFQYL